MNEVRTIQFSDAETQEAVVAIVRADKQIVSLAVSLQSDGDFEVFLPIDICRSLIDAMTEAVDDAIRA